MYDGEARNDFLSVSGDFIYRHHVQPRLKNCTCREKNHFPIPLKHIDVTRNTHTSLDVMLEKHVEDNWNVEIENWQMHGQDLRDLFC